MHALLSLDRPQPGAHATHQTARRTHPRKMAHLHATRTPHHIALFALPLLAFFGLLSLLALAPVPASTLAAPLTRASTSPAGEATCTPGNLVSYGRPLIVAAGRWICGDADAYGASVRVEGHVSGNVTALGGGVFVSGEVDGNVTALGGNVEMAPGARVAGDVWAAGGTSRRSPGATVYGSVERSDRVASTFGGPVPGITNRWRFPWTWILGWSAVAALIATVFPERTARIGTVAGHLAVRSVVVGILTTVLGVSLAALLFATCVGIPVSLVVVAVLLVGWVLGTVAVGQWLGERVMRTVAPGKHATVLRAVLGVALLAGVESIPAVGAIVTVAVSSLALGATLLSRFGARGPAVSLSRRLTPPT